MENLAQSVYAERLPGRSCVPTALHEVAPADVDPDTVWQLCQERSEALRRGEGMYYHEALDVLHKLGVHYQPGARRWPRRTLAAFVQEEPRGVWLVWVRGHALVVRNGKVIDPNWGGRRALRRRVQACQLILNAGPGKYAPAWRK